jgi:methylamine utilization protein MauE
LDRASAHVESEERVVYATAVVTRTVLAVVFLSAAIWKAGHYRDFAAAYGALAPRFQLVSPRAAQRLLTALEAVCAGAVAAGIGYPQAAAIGPALALVLLLAFTCLIVAAADFTACGCWSMPFVKDGQQAKRLLITRNGALVLVAALSLLVLPSGPQPALIAPVAAGVLLGLIVLELPQILAVATFNRVSQAAG